MLFVALVITTYCILPTFAPDDSGYIVRDNNVFLIETDFLSQLNNSTRAYAFYL